jgi:hypothetical protein
MTHTNSTPANPAQGVSDLLIEAAEMAERSATLNEVYQPREEYVRFAQECRAAIGASPKPPGWPDPLESPQAEALRNGKVDDTEIRNLFDCMERELRLHRERAANPVQVTDALDGFSQYRRKQIAELRPWVSGDDMSRISVSAPRQGGRFAQGWRHDRTQPEEP